MIKIFFSTWLLLFGLPGFSQTNPIDESYNPSGIGFGGAMGGATSNTYTSISSSYRGTFS